MTPAELDLRHYAVLGLVAEASDLAMSYFGRQDALGISMKGAQDWLTAADGAVESFFRDKLATLFPGDSVFGEEGGGEAGEALWIIDPIDGTANFARADRIWCISIGFHWRGEAQIGVIAAPALDELYVARKGGGATLNGRRLAVSDTTDIARASIEMGWSSRRRSEDYVAMVARGYEAGAVIRRSGSGALGLCNVACGRTDAYVESHINSWDVAAGLLIAAEAGAATNDFFTAEAIRQGNPVLCVTPALAPALERITGIVSRRNSAGGA